MKEERLYSLMTSRELTWEGLIRDIVTGEGLDPWDIDITSLTNTFVQAVRDLKQKDIRVSGKFLLAAAILLKMKADYLIAKVEEENMSEGEKEAMAIEDMGSFEIEPRLPVPKKRKVTLDELINSLRKALVVKERREVRHKERKIEINLKLKTVDVGEKIRGLYNRITGFFSKFKTSELTFSQLIPSRHRWDMIWTFIPLIHLANKGKITLKQDEPFGEIYVKRRDGTEGTERGREETESSN